MKCPRCELEDITTLYSPTEKLTYCKTCKYHVFGEGFENPIPISFPVADKVLLPDLVKAGATQLQFKTTKKETICYIYAEGLENFIYKLFDVNHCLNKTLAIAIENATKLIKEESIKAWRTNDNQ